MPFVSVIAPAFNVGPSVERAFSAMRDQSFPDFELIVCDDGSSDGTFEACSSAAAGDERMRVVRLPHGGVCAARNAGIELARGDALAFLDMDDAPHPLWLEGLVRGLEEADLSVGGYEVRDSEGLLMHDTSAVGDSSQGPLRLTSDEFRVALFSNSLMYQGYVWNKLFRRDLVEGPVPLRFRDGVSRNEDRLFVFEYLERAVAVAFAGEPRYTYFAHPLTGEYRSSWASELAAFDVMVDRLGESSAPLSEEALRFAERDCYRATAELLVSAASAGHDDARWLAERLCALSGRGFRFDEYSDSFRLFLDEALALARSLLADAASGRTARA